MARKTPPGQLLYKAAKTGSIEEIEQALAEGASINDPAGPSYHPALVAAVDAGQEAAVELLLSRGADPLRTGTVCVTALGRAMAMKNSPLLLALLRTPRTLESDAAGLSPLHLLAIEDGDPILVEVLVELGCDLQAKMTESAHAAMEAKYLRLAANLIGATPLHLAVALARPAIVAGLLAWGADPEAKDAAGRAPHSWIYLPQSVIPEDTLEIVARLLAYGSKPVTEHSVPRGFRTLVDYASLPEVQARVAAIEVIRKNRQGRRPEDLLPLTPHDMLAQGARSGDIARLRAAVAEGAKLNKQPRGKTPPLVLAANNGHVAAVEWLLSSGAEPNVKGPTGRSALHGACERGNLEIATLLLDAGADPNAIDNRGVAPVHSLARRSASVAVLRLLAERGADLAATVDDDHFARQEMISAIGLATWESNYDFVRAMIEVGREHGKDYSTPGLIRLLRRTRGASSQLADWIESLPQP